jgi:hypothetical protein
VRQAGSAAPTSSPGLAREGLRGEHRPLVGAATPLLALLVAIGRTPFVAEIVCRAQAAGHVGWRGVCRRGPAAAHVRGVCMLLVIIAVIVHQAVICIAWL